MPDVQDLNNFFGRTGRTVHDNVGRADELTGSMHSSRSPKARECCQLLNTFNNLIVRYLGLPRGSHAGCA